MIKLYETVKLFTEIGGVWKGVKKLFSSKKNEKPKKRRKKFALYATATVIAIAGWLPSCLPTSGNALISINFNFGAKEQAQQEIAQIQKPQNRKLFALRSEVKGEEKELPLPQGAVSKISAKRIARYVEDDEKRPFLRCEERVRA